MPISEVFHGDCMEYMRTIPDKYFDLCIADPPYGINAAKMTMGLGHHDWKKQRKGWDTTIPHDDVFREILRVAKHAIIWGGNYFPLPPTNAWIVWDKGYDGRLSFSDGEMAWTNMPINMRIHRIIRQNTLDYDAIRIHPTQKPVALYAWLLDNYMIGGGGKIFDPFLGSGSSRIAAYKKGFDFYGCELDDDYYKAQEERFQRECHGITTTKDGRTIQQMTLF
jgi:site-specific DNA-methyltransferase (adenine-specific)